MAVVEQEEEVEEVSDVQLFKKNLSKLVTCWKFQNEYLFKNNKSILYFSQ